MKDRLLVGGASGLFLGLLAGLIEWLRLGLTVRGAGFQPLILVYGQFVDGGAGLIVGVLAALAWHLWRGNRQQASPGVTVTIVWKGQPAPRPWRPVPAISRRAALKLGVAAVSVGALGAGVLTWTARRQNGRAPSGGSDPVDSVAEAPAAYAYTPPSNSLAVERTNFLLVTLDTLRADQLGVYGHPTVKTPALDLLASQGARFDMHLVQEPATNPSHASMFTGMYPPSNGVRVHMVDKINSSLDTLAQAFSTAGYFTSGIYSWLSLDNQYCGFQRGFDVYQNVAGGMSGLLDNPVLRKLAAEYRVAEQYLALARSVSDATGVQQEMEWKNKGRADITTDAAIAQLKVLGRRPFFAWVHYFDPHYPYVPPAPYDEKYNPGYTGKLRFDMPTIEAIEKGRMQPSADDVKRLMSLYQGEISYLDFHLGRLFNALDSLGLAQNTVLTVTADHGESFGEHSTFKEDTDYFHPHDLYNTEQRTPLFIRYPGHIKPGTLVTAPTQAIDLFPTLLDFAGLKVPAQNQGRSVVQLLDGSDSGADRRAFSVMPDYVFSSVSVPGWKLIHNNASGAYELYDVRADPNETHEVAQAHPQLTAQMMGWLQSWMKAHKVV